MANDINQNPMVIDTAASTPILNPMGGTKIWVNEILWLAPAGTLVISMNGSPNITFNPPASGDDYAIAHQPFGWVDPLIISTKGGGNVLIFCDQP